MTIQSPDNTPQSYADRWIEHLQGAENISQTRIGKSLFWAARHKLIGDEEVNRIDAAAKARRKQLIADGGSDQIPLADEPLGRPVPEQWSPSDVLDILPKGVRELDSMERQLPVGDRNEHLAA